MAKSAGFQPLCAGSIPAFVRDLVNGPVGEEEVETWKPVNVVMPSVQSTYLFDFALYKMCGRPPPQPAEAEHRSPSYFLIHINIRDCKKIYLVFEAYQFTRSFEE
jgi:hypothetical protein